MDPLVNQFDAVDRSARVLPAARRARERAVGRRWRPSWRARARATRSCAAPPRRGVQRPVTLAAHRLQVRGRRLRASRSRRRPDGRAPFDAGAGGEAARGARLPGERRVRREGVRGAGVAAQQARDRAAAEPRPRLLGADPPRLSVARRACSRSRSPLLDRLYHPVTLARVQDNELRSRQDRDAVPDGGPVLRPRRRRSGRSWIAPVRRSRACAATSSASSCGS